MERAVGGAAEVREGTAVLLSKAFAAKAEQLQMATH